MNSTSRESVAILIPCYNGGKFIAEALDSALAQTRPAETIIVVDDGSTDDSAAVVRQYIAAHRQTPIELVQRSNGGEPAARNTGITAAGQAGATWVAMLDSDDWWESNKLELQLAAARAAGPECVLIHTGVVGHLPDGKTTLSDFAAGKRRTGWCTAALLEPFSIGHPSILVRRSALEQIGGYDETFKQACDIDLYLRLSAVGTFAFVDKPLLHYRYHAGQMSRSPLDQIAYHHRAVKQFFAAHPDAEQKIGKQAINDAMAGLVAVKLGSLYWRRRLADFRGLLDYAQREGLDSPVIADWRKRARYPDWLIHLKDRLGGNRSPAVQR